MKNFVSSVIVPRITENTGIRISPIHEKSLELHIEKMAFERGLSFEKYCDLLVPSSKEFEALINVATTNETYFFRERIQFEFLQKKIFPAYTGKKIVMWSGACASGEEPVSLYSLAISCGVRPEIHASDIDSNELAHFKKGIYTKYSLNQDGKEFHPLLEETLTGQFKDGKFYLNEHIFESIKIHQYNLANKVLPDFFDKADIVFLRNVFIYFDNNLRKEILEKAAEKLIPGGLLFLSVGEICCIGNDLIPQCLEKRNFGKVYYFIKKGGTNSLLSALLIDKEKDSSSNLENLTAFINKKIEAKNEKEKKEEEKSIKYVLEAMLPPSENRTPKEIFTKVNMFLSQKNYEGAKDFLKDYNPTFQEKFYKEYYLALIFKYQMNYEEAVKHFVLAETMCSTFWPAYFYHGLILRDQGKEVVANRCLEKCIKHLESYLDSKNDAYDFLTESFSPEYFYSLCKKYVLEGEKK